MRRACEAPWRARGAPRYRPEGQGPGGREAMASVVGPLERPVPMQAVAITPKKRGDEQRISPR